MPVIPTPGAPWYLQKYEYTPGWSNAVVNVASGARLPESNDPSSAVTVCGLFPSLDHSIDWPGWMRTIPASNALSIALISAS